MRVLILFLSFAGLYGLSQGCSCVDVPAFEKYCNSAFAMLILVESGLNNPSGKPKHDYYDIKIENTFKTKNKIGLHFSMGATGMVAENNDRGSSEKWSVYNRTCSSASEKANADHYNEKRLYSRASNDGVCGVSLVMDTTYIITGQIEKNILSAHSCFSWIAPDTPEMIKEVEKYKEDEAIGICPATTR